MLQFGRSPEALRLTDRASDVHCPMRRRRIGPWVGSGTPIQMFQRNSAEANLPPMLRAMGDRDPRGVPWRWRAASVWQFRNHPTVQLRHSSSGRTAALYEAKSDGRGQIVSSPPNGVCNFPGVIGPTRSGGSPPGYTHRQDAPSGARAASRRTRPRPRWGSRPFHAIVETGALGAD